MKRLALTTAALLATTVGAHAADMAVKAPVYKAPIMAVYDWTGFYIGVNAGYGVGRDRTHANIDIGGPVALQVSTYLQPAGGFGGGQIGYNWQTGSMFGPLVYGVEADIQGGSLSDSFPAFGTTNAYSQKLDWFGTVRGRIGLATGPVLSYVTGGFAYGNVTTSTVLGLPTLAGGRTETGWTVGSGVEAALGGNWTGKIEYLYMNLGNHTDTVTLGGFLPVAYTTELRQNIFRAGLNYRIGGSTYTPVVAANWTGWYLGGNIGSGIGRDHTQLSTPGTAPFESFNLAPDGINGGLQIGYNWQSTNWVYGLEADIQGSSQRDNKTQSNTGLFAYDAKLPWFGTVRGRLGYSLGSTLFYATGGYAYGGVKTDVSVSEVGLLLSPGSAVVGSTSTTRSGWTAGAGIETPFTLLGLFGPNWTSKTEYLYVDLGTVDNNLTYVVPGGTATPFTVSSSVKEHIFRTGLNYHFNSPVIAKY